MGPTSKEKEKKKENQKEEKTHEADGGRRN